MPRIIRTSRSYLLVADATFTDVVPTEYRADAVVLLVQREPVLGVIFEAQLQANADKTFVWPAYLFSARARHRCPSLPKDLRLLYSALIERVLSPAARKAFIMHPTTEPLLSSWHREGFEKGLQEGVEKGLQEGVEKGLQQGIEKGLAQARAADILDALDARGMPVSQEQRARILSCSDLVLLKAWFRRSVTATTTDEIFL